MCGADRNAFRVLVGILEKHITSSVYDCTVEDVEYHNVAIVTHSHHLVVVITLP